MSKKRLKKKPPFYWPLINVVALLMILLELGILIQERAWSQNYSAFALELRDQVEKINYENQLIFAYLKDYYNFLNNNELGMENPQRVYLFQESVSLKK